MTSKDIVNYIEEGKKRGFSVQLLKKKLLEGGFSEKDVDEAVKMSGGMEKPSPVSVKGGEKSAKPMKPAMGLDKKTGGKIKWMKIGGWVGIAMLILGIAVGAIGNFVGNSIVLITLGVVFLALIFFFYFGFIKLGTHAESKLLRVASILTIISVVLPIFVIALVFSSMVGTSGLLSEGIGIEIISFGVIVLLLIVSQILFAIGLVKIGKQVRFAKVAGILNIVALALGVLLAIYLVLVLRTLAANLAGGLYDPDITSLIVLVLGAGVAGLVRLVANVFEILVLFKASRKFEQGLVS